MIIKDEIRILLFYPAVHASLAVHLKNEIEACGPPKCKIHVLLHPADEPLPADVADRIQALMVIFTSQLNKNPHLFNLIKSVAHKRTLERFLVLPKDSPAGKTTFPALLHPIRAQQHHIIGYSVSEERKLTLESFKDSLLKAFTERLPNICSENEKKLTENKHGLFNYLKRAWQSPRRNIIFISVLVFIGLVFGAYTLFPQFVDAINDQIAASIMGFKIPELGVAWLDEGFTRLDADQWQETHRFLGHDPFLVEFSERRLSLRAMTPIEHAIYRLESVEAFPLESLQAFEVSFLIETLIDGGGESEVSYQLTLEENPQYFFGCSLFLDDPGVDVACYVEEPDQRLVISGPVSLSLNETHILTVVFVPESFVLRFFMDGAYFGRMPITSVQEWMVQGCSTMIQVEGKNLDQGSFGFNLDHVKIFQQGDSVIYE